MKGVNWKVDFLGNSWSSHSFYWCEGNGERGAFLALLKIVIIFYNQIRLVWVYLKNLSLVLMKVDKVAGLFICVFTIKSIFWLILRNIHIKFYFSRNWWKYSYICLLILLKFIYFIIFIKNFPFFFQVSYRFVWNSYKETFFRK